MRKTLGLMLGFLLVLSACAAPATPTPAIVPSEIPTTPIALATSTPQITATPTPFFVLYSDKPIVSKGQPGTWDDRFTDPGAVIYNDGMLHMFRNGFRGFPAESQIGYVTSPDGYTWTKQEDDQPVLKTSDVPYAKIAMYASSVIREGNCWVLFFYTWDSRSFPSSSVIGRAVECIGGPVMAQWFVDSKPVLQPGSDGAWDEKQVLAPHVIKTEDGYIMYYSGVDDSGIQRIGMATSSDGVTWTKYNNPETTDEAFVESDPVFNPDVSDTWDAGWVHQPRVFQTANGWIMIYRGTKTTTGEKMAIGLATSQDGISWERSSLNPIFTPRDIPKAGYLWFHNALLINDTLYLFVEGDINQSTQIYLATHEGEITPATSIPASETDSPEVLDTASVLSVGHIDPIRIVPFDLDPASDFEHVVSEYKKVMSGDPQPTSWYSGTTDGKFKFQITLDLANQDDSPLITLQYPIRVEISLIEVSPNSLNLIAPIFSGGGGPTNSFPSFELQPGSIELTPTYSSGEEMNSGGLVGILYDISAACVQTGVYKVFFQIPYDVTNSEGTESKLVTYTMILACPQELNVWMFNPDDDSLFARQTLLFENGKYIQKP